MIGNSSKIIFLLSGMTLLFIILGNLLGGSQGMFIAFIFSIGINFFSYWYSDKIILKMYNAREISSSEFPEFYQLTQELSLSANLPIPKVFVIDQETPNAFATGRNEENAVVAVTTGLLKIMNRKELSGVLAHELAHIKNKDILIGTIVATMAGAITMLASMARWSALFGGNTSRGDNERLGTLDLILTSILAPLAAVIVQMAISRTREYLADSTGAIIAGEAKGLADALQKLGSYSSVSKMNANPTTAHMFIINPLSGKSLQTLFSTHPSVDKRIKKLLGESRNQNIDTKSVGDTFWDHLNGK